MKKVILLFALMFSVSTAFISCREEAEDTEDQIEEVGDEVEDEEEEM